MARKTADLSALHPCAADLAPAQPANAAGFHQTVQLLGTSAQHAHDPLLLLDQLAPLIFEPLPYAVFWKDPDLAYVGCNSKYAELAGLKQAADIRGRNDFSLHWKDEHAAQMRLYDSLLLRHALPQLYVLEMMHASSGERLWLKVDLIPLLSAEKTPLGVLGVAEDISRLKRLQSTLAACDAQLKLLLANLPATVWTVDLDLNLHIVSGRGFPVMLFKRSGAGGLSLYDSAARKDSPLYPLLTLTKRALSGEAVSCEICFERKKYQIDLQALRKPGRGILGAIGMTVELHSSTGKHPTSFNL